VKARQRQTCRIRNVVAAAAVVLLPPLAARAQVPDSYMLDQYFQQGVPGTGNTLGTTVLSRARPEYDPLGIRVGDFIVRPEVDESVGYNSNVIGQTPAKGSPVIVTDATLRVGSDWARNSLGGSFNVTNTQVPGLSTQNNTAWNVAVGGSYDIGRDTVTLDATHQYAFILPYGIDVVSFNRPGILYFTPIPYSLNDVRGSYTAVFGRFSVTPGFDFTNVTYGGTSYFGLDGFVPPPPVNGAVLGSPTSLSYLNHNVYQGSITARYEYAPLRDFLVVVNGARIDYTSATAGAFGPSRSGEEANFLVGLDYTANGVWRYRVLAGVRGRRDLAALRRHQRDAARRTHDRGCGRSRRRRLCHDLRPLAGGSRSPAQHHPDRLRLDRERAVSRYRRRGGDVLRRRGRRDLAAQPQRPSGADI
jgi:hypothetical protein